MKFSLFLASCLVAASATPHYDDWRDRQDGYVSNDYQRGQGQFEYQREREHGQFGYQGGEGQLGYQGGQGQFGYDRDQGRPDFGRNPNRKMNVAKQESNAESGDKGVAVSSGSAAAGQSGILPEGGANIAKQHSNSVSGDNGVSTASGSATAGRVKRSIDDNDPDIPRVVLPVAHIVSSAKQISTAASVNGPVSASGSATAVREKRDVASVSSHRSIISGNGVRINTAQEISQASTDSLGGASASGTVVSGGNY